MALLLGLDTGGTFTDAALLEIGEGQPRVIAKAKALTTRHDLAIGLAGAAQKAIETSGRSASEIGLVSLSTTLATNALVEGQGGRVALIAIGFEPRDLDKAGLAEALGSDPVIHLAGGHTTHGAQAAELDLAPLEAQIGVLTESVSGFAVAGYFAVRNPAHERAVRDFIAERTGKAVTCSHELSAKLNGPKRALTTVLNARLVPMITRLIAATRRTLDEAGVTAPVMVVRGDGALVGADFATRRPIETILSGPAASLVGARFLTGLDNAFVNDIGGTTSDIALLQDGRPKIDDRGATVGGFRTMVEAVAMHTFGLGGDSEVGTGGSALAPQITLGPRRLVPVSLTASQHADAVHAALDRQLKSVLNGRHDARFAFRSGSGIDAGLSDGERRLFDKLDHEPIALDQVLEGNAQAAALARLVGRGLVMVAGLTPSDAMHALGRNDIWDGDAALKTLQLFARRRDGSGQSLAQDPLDLAHRIVARVERRSAEVVLETAWSIDGRDGSALVGHELVRDTLDRRQEGAENAANVAFDMVLSKPLIGLGASAFQYHPGAARLLATQAVVPEHADVANAIGAVVGQIAMRVEITITQPVEGRFSVTGIDLPFAQESEALAAAEEHARIEANRLGREAGAEEIVVTVDQSMKRADFEGRDMLIEATIVAVAAGRPPIVG
ncbi:hydantoinase/oxoprolinase N-terminal domain-containing protein [Pseudahrensia aquimaris]|uniref:Hydantoinase/oxoprolinase N-terminal domain-containing protein n=1 Tax=Pseudahrensia aquimaris TaxID=744461 RepID=A0ABW3FJ92_9HYPH